jgi:signal transduction histidine kinase
LEEVNCRVLTDEKWLVFVLEQLISNALKYTNQGKICIYLDQQSEKTLIIEDTGVGIRDEDITRIFDRGFTGYNGRMDKKSTGIGLYLCQQVLNKLSHSIIVSSQVGQGTRVSIDLSTKRFEAL